MAYQFTESDLAALEKLLLSGAKKITDGSKSFDAVSTNELMAKIAHIKDRMAASQGTRVRSIAAIIDEGY